MRGVTVEMLSDEDFREEVAEAAYMRERSEELAVERETETSDDFAYFVMAWGSLSDDAKRPYRTAVAEAFDHVLELEAA
jgi:hypothetical protein